MHLIDHMIEFAGEVKDVLCVSGQYIPGPAADDTTTIMLRFKNGATGTLFCSVATATDFRFTLYGTKGLAEILAHRSRPLPLRADLRRAAVTEL